MKVGITILRHTLSIFCVALVLQFSAGTPLVAQEQSAPSPLQPLSPDQLDNLVAPIALYPDALLSQVLVASTYPLELVEAGQWLQQNQNLQGPQLVDAARQQNWDPSIQALVVFPDVIDRLNSDIRWTTDLGNAFLGAAGGRHERRAAHARRSPSRGQAESPLLRKPSRPTHKAARLRLRFSRPILT